MIQLSFKKREFACSFLFKKTFQVISEIGSLSTDCLPNLLVGNGDNYLHKIVKHNITLNRSCFGSSFSYGANRAG
ncbi:hypothetical protein [Peribacillus simplex]|uniref:hypothetical protein n=1 Tax=Peribacillus simplex TaxID=1478 RepID=UPI0024C19DD3|nr:hypothetical protein [Peribacillus simplex]WHY96965.1 hypothetical protein QNH37_23860 [Peribacillus simplex]